MLIKNALAYTPEGLLRRDILIEGGRIAALGENLPGKADIDAAGMLVSPGFVDLHTHLREPGFLYKETIASGTAAAAAGGYTTVCAMPNLSPAPDSLPHLEQELACIEKSARIRVLPYGCITVGEKGQTLVPFAEMAPFCAGFSDDGKGVQEEGVMREAMEEAARAGRLLCAHCEVESLLEGGYVHEGPWAKRHGYKGICSQSETQEVERDIRLASETGCRLHLCHLSAKESLAAVEKAKRAGAPVTCEVTPHQALLCDEDISEDSGRFKMNPPLREQSDRAAIQQALASGLVDAIATDHAPHSAKEKAGGLAGSAMGVSGLECAFAALYTGLVRTGILPLEKLLFLFTAGPASVLGLSAALAEGEAADLVVIDLREEWTVSGNSFLSLGKATPFEGKKVAGKVKYTLYNGKIVYQEAAL